MREGCDLRAAILPGGVCYNFAGQHFRRRLAMTADQSSANPNRLYFGDNLDILREHVADESVDLIYLDPQFNSNVNYNAFFQEHTGEPSSAQITAFEDTWHWGFGIGGRLPRYGDGRAGKAVRPVAGDARLSGTERHDGLPVDDGAAHRGTAPRPQTYRQHLPALRPYRQSLPEAADGRCVWTKEFS